MLTVLFATHNGARTLRSVLATYSQLMHPNGGWKLVVVDNASTDNSRQILDSFRDQLPIEYVYERTPGKNAALNTGLEFVEGDLVVLTDDDVFPRQDWLIALREAADNYPEYAVFGGRVLPRWETAPPEWVTAWVPRGPVYTISSDKLFDGPASPENIYGPNMAVRADVFAAGVRFDPSVGPNGSNYAMGSETELVIRLARLGYRIRCVPDAEVEHFIRNYQLQREWILRRATRFGRGQFRLGASQQARDVATWVGVPRHLFREFFREFGVALKAALTFDEETAFRARWTLNFLWGQIIEARNIRVHSRELRLHTVP
ncbi:MAG TPA: glycosyltransferase [Gemmatimonadaceae bacterium]|nr:glycosyltransferase [Gemmatimonadaceae bacterium]